ncbi:hypothetical protein SOM08_11835 [Hydrogenophaga sp. SNF1]|uniref:hypothetical protein n=1 Tax=Hydrogenophaga sp. SNF1 TaxID=3098762 RepID=UPI002ACBDCD7|nr:hypothetical protein [Hydrogenophaga sp. SNF1]WQB81707.1 hypothetical protein SOM08_11835 [Hydrogenophaga sp. SNF1]
MQRLTPSGTGLFSTGRTTHTGSLHRASRRHLVPPEVLGVLRRMPWFPQAVARYRFQAFADCLAHSERLQEALIRDLCADQLMALEPAADGPDTLDTRTEEDPGAERIAGLGVHGPLSLTMAHALGPGQGGRLYRDHHGFVVLFTVCYEGRPIAVAMDGNDLQQNEVMDHVRAYTDRHDLACEDLQAAEFRDVQRALPGPLDIAQLCFRLIDLDSLVKASRAKHQATRLLPPTGLASRGAGVPGPGRHANMVRWVANAQLRRPPLPADGEDALFALFRRSPELIERFEWPPASRPGFEE